MEIYLIIVVVLCVLAISDLMVGVSNDAVNFLNSAIGSKVAPRHIIMIVASLGILVGTTFSSGLMEVARKGIFHPDMFFLSEIMTIFLAVMITDVLLLDMFNTFGLPTSTTVSIVFELLGSAVAVSLWKIAAQDGNLAEIINYINTGKALAIISGILLSVVIAFSVGAIMQFLTRILFSFNFSKNIKYFGSLWGGLALSAITYFILVKGAKGTSFLDKETISMIKDNTWTIVGISFVFWAIVLQLIMLTTKANILKGIVLVGTFALALAFAANDLVNFIGVPLAGISSYVIGTQSSDPDSLVMTALKGKVQTDTLLLLLAGSVMVVTLWFNKKSRSVTKTEINLSRQNIGAERFESSILSRTIVRMSVSLSNGLNKVTPQPVQNFINTRFEHEQNAIALKPEDAPAFDLIRAANNLMVASVLISIATSLKLPLSTTYVTFMVAMGTSLADRAWGRDSAVYRVNGVLTVIGGWFFTAFSAFTTAFVLASIIFFGGIYAIFGLIAIACYVLFRTHILHKKRAEDEADEEVEYTESDDSSEIFKSIVQSIEKYLVKLPAVYNATIYGLKTEDRIKLKEALKDAKKLRKRSNNITANIFSSIETIKDDNITEKRLGKLITSLQEISNKSVLISSNAYSHIDNNHKALSTSQKEDLIKVCELFELEVNTALNIIKTKDYESIQKYTETQDELVVRLAEFENSQVARIKNEKDSARNSMLHLGILSYTEIISFHLGKLLNNLKNTL
ncbi:MAG: anion permease [Rhodothermaceae bacterium]